VVVYIVRGQPAAVIARLVHVVRITEVTVRAAHAIDGLGAYITVVQCVHVLLEQPSTHFVAELARTATPSVAAGTT